ncbi:MAG: hypothetical protein ABIS92_03515, partial [Polyangia bacterium]
EKQIERDEKATRIPGARDLLGETRVALAVIQNKDQATPKAISAVAQAEAPAMAGASSKKGKKSGKAAGKSGGKKKGKKK